MRFKDRVALVTGGGRGIGAASARLLAAEGARVAVSDLDDGPAREVADAIGGLAVSCDVSDRAPGGSMVEVTLEEVGRLHGVVTCAGVIRGQPPVKMTARELGLVV